MGALTLILFLISAPFVNDYTASHIAREIKNLPLPENTEYIDSVSAAAKLSGNGNGMQFFGAMLIKSELPLEQLDRYYADYRTSDWDLLVEVQAGQKIEGIDHRDLTFQVEMQPDASYYIVYTWGDGIFPFAEFDIRGN